MRAIMARSAKQIAAQKKAAKASATKRSNASSKIAPMVSHDAAGKANKTIRAPRLQGKPVSSNITVKMTTYAKHRMSGDPLKQARAFQGGGRYGTVIQSKSRGTSYDIETRKAKK